MSIPSFLLWRLFLFQVALSISQVALEGHIGMSSSLLDGELFPEVGPRNYKVKTTLSYIILIFGQNAEKKLKTPSHNPRFCFINKTVLIYKLECK